MEILSNDQITIAVKEHGAELASLKHNGREYLWQADETFWKRHSPVLFPIVGSVWGGVFRAKGVTYKMGQHGFARDMDFKLIDKTADEVRYRLESTPETLAKYPYDFVLEIGYKLIGQSVRVSWKVVNTGKEVLPFQIGAHPAFFWPMLTDAEIEGGVTAMAPALAATDRRGYFKIESESKTMPISLIKEGGCVGNKDVVTLDADGCLPISISSFDHNALIFEDSMVSEVTLCGEDKKPYVTLVFDSPLVGLWSPPGQRAPFVCIEPWYGRCDTVGYDGDINDRQWMQHLQAGQTFTAHYDIVVPPTLS